jgi:hypothetical protein
MNEQEFKQRTKNLALRIIKLVETLPKNATARVIGNQLLRSGTSVGANYRAACRAKSTADILNKLAIVEEEAFPFWIGDLGFWINKTIALAPKSPTQIDDSRCFFLNNSPPKEQFQSKIQNLKSKIDMIVASIKTIRQGQNGRNPKSKILNPKSI